MQNSDKVGLIVGFTNAWKWSIIFRFLASINTAGNSIISNLKMPQINNKKFLNFYNNNHKIRTIDIDDAKA